MFYFDFLVSLGPIFLEKTIFGYSKVVSRPSMDKIHNLQFAKGNSYFFRLQTSIMVYKITSVMILRSSFININLMSEKKLSWLKNEELLENTIKGTNYTLYRNWSNTHFQFLLRSGFDREPLKLHKQMIPHF